MVILDPFIHLLSGSLGAYVWSQLSGNNLHGNHNPLTQYVLSPLIPVQKKDTSPLSNQENSINGTPSDLTI